LTLAFGLANMGVDPKVLEYGKNAEFDQVKTELVSEQEFQKLRNQIESDFIQRNSSMAGIAESLANYHTYYGNANLINTEIERYMKVTREDLSAAAKKYYTPQNRVVLYFLNDPKLSSN
jgi:predicted Zn-dependent peptidase